MCLDWKWSYPKRISLANYAEKYRWEFANIIRKHNIWHQQWCNCGSHVPKFHPGNLISIQSMKPITYHYHYIVQIQTINPVAGNLQSGRQPPKSTQFVWNMEECGSRWWKTWPFRNEKVQVAATTKSPGLWDPLIVSEREPPSQNPTATRSSTAASGSHALFAAGVEAAKNCRRHSYENMQNITLMCWTLLQINPQYAIVQEESGRKIMSGGYVGNLINLMQAQLNFT